MSPLQPWFLLGGGRMWGLLKGSLQAGLPWLPALLSWLGLPGAGSPAFPWVVGRGAPGACVPCRPLPRPKARSSERLSRWKSA